MSRRYGHAISVACDGSHDGGDQEAGMCAPQGFVWRGITYQVAEVLATWHLRDRWWQPGPAEQAKQWDYQPNVAVPPVQPGPFAVSPRWEGQGWEEQGWEEQAHRADVVPRIGESRASSDRFYYRVRCTSGLICELYYDAVSGDWVLDRVHD